MLLIGCHLVALWVIDSSILCLRIIVRIVVLTQPVCSTRFLSLRALHLVMEREECFKCKTSDVDYLVYCLQDGYWFCNSKLRTDKYSHAVEHHEQTNHTMAIKDEATQIDELNIDCRRCGSCNLFELGLETVDFDYYESRFNILFYCEDCSQKKVTEPVVSVDGFLHEFIAEKVEMKGVLSFDSKSKYVEEYNNFLDREIQAELEASSEVLTVKNVTIQWTEQNRGIIPLRGEAKNLINAYSHYEIICISLPNDEWFGEAEVMASENDELLISLFASDHEEIVEAILPETRSDFHVTYSHKYDENVNYEYYKRLRGALHELQNRNDDNQLVELLTGKFNFRSQPQ